MLHPFPTAQALDDPPLGVDQERVRNAREDAVGRPDLPVEIEHDWKEIEAVRAQLRPHRLRASRDLDPDQLRAFVRRQRGQRLLEEAEQVVAVRAGVEEEDQDQRLAALGGHVEALLGVEDRRAEDRGQRMVAGVELGGVGPRGQPQRLADLLLDRDLGAGLVGGELAQAEGHVALGIRAQDRHRHAQAHLQGDGGVRIVEDRKIEAVALGELRRARPVRSGGDPRDLEVVLAAQRRDRLDRLRDDGRLLHLRVEEEEQQPLSEQVRDVEALIVEGPPGHGGERPLLARACWLGRRCARRIGRSRRGRHRCAGCGGIRRRRCRFLPASEREGKRQRRGEGPEAHGPEHTLRRVPIKLGEAV